MVIFSTVSKRSRWL